MGRDEETRRVVDAVDAGRHGPRSLLLLGEAGAGKTSLLDLASARAAATGRTVLAAGGCAAESELSFAVLHQLLGPLLPGAGALPPHLGEAVAAACGLAGVPVAPDPTALRLGVLALLGAAARQRPVLVTVDDVQLVDRDTCEVLSFVLRRLTDERLVVLLAARASVRPARVEATVPAVVLGPLGESAAARLLDGLPDAPTGRARIDVLQQAAGNPLALVELARAVASGAALPGRDLPRGARLREMFADRLRELPEETRRLLVYAAAAEQEDLATTMAAAGVGDDLSGWAPAERAGLVVVVRGRVGFRHPLVRAAAYEGAPAELRARAHRDIAAAVVGDPARRAWHLSEAAVAPDEAVARALEETVALAQLRGGRYATARALERAAECTPDPGRRARRYARAVTAADDFGDPAWIRDLYAQVTRLTTDPDVLGVAAAGAGHGLSLSGHQREAFELLRASLQDHRPRDGSTALALTGVLAAVRVQSGLPGHGASLRALLDRLGGDPPGDPAGLVPLPVRPAMLENVLVQSDPDAHARRVLEDPGAAVHRRLDGPVDVARLLSLSSTAWFADEPEAAVEAFRQARGRGSPGMIVMCVPALASAMLDTGRWADAELLLAEAAELAVVHRFRYLAADVAALRGELAALRGQPRPVEVRAAVDLDENRATHARLLRAAGLAAAAAGDHEGAYRHFRALYGVDGTALHYFLSPRSIAEFAAAARAVRARDDAAAVVAAVRAAQPERPTARLRLQLHHADALVAELDDHAPRARVERSYRLAVVDPAGEQWPLERARARLHYARWLRGQSRPLDAHRVLAAARDTFARLGATGLADRARLELRAGGGPVPSVSSVQSVHEADPLAELTAQQREVVLLAARGLRNREIAERLFLSPRTVGSHLHNAYPKLGVSGRHQLREVIGDLPQV
ncbi:helix-turn-helix transcriptional regulator [Saccharothrix syringae]|uniref:Helix-turn-helix transcriptional regulator n=1 Tax=Saccharothrix syringae TaxID=103733 RepID=A0A5Q0HDX8_SACSY|nr:helix-turn-helix transcriptional regulator [Saccharothrix syringae]